VRGLDFEDAQRILLQPDQAVLGQLIPMRLEMRDQRVAPSAISMPI
jgi:hypothetical protein